LDNIKFKDLTAEEIEKINRMSDDFNIFIKKYYEDTEIYFNFLVMQVAHFAKCHGIDKETMLQYFSLCFNRYESEASNE
jgi:hypothetical protein